MKRSMVSLAVLLSLSAGVVIHTAGCAGTTTQRSTGEFVDDATITTRVKATFVQDPLVQALDVGVDTFKGVVQLNGFVDSNEQKARAEQLARSIPGVANVENKLSVKARAVP